jgi:PAS domain S-box-containing protein
MMTTASLPMLRRVLDHHPDLIYIKDSDGRFLLANQAVAELYGTTVDELIGKSDKEFSAHAREARRSAAAEQEVIAGRKSTFSGGEAITDARTGSTRFFDVRRVPFEEDGDGCHVLVTAIETTDRRVAEAALRSSDDQVRQMQKMEAIGQLAGGVAHEFNNLLTAILGYTALLIETTDDRPDIAADLQEIRKAGERASGLTRQLLTFSRKQAVQPAILDLNQVLSELEKTLRQVVGDAVEIEIVNAPSLGLLRADPKQIEQMLVNLAANARDAMPHGGRLRLETRSEILAFDPRDPLTPTRWPSVVLLVADTGTGIAPEIASRVFEPFFTTKGQGKGTGLGLAMVYGIVSQIGGVVTFESERGRGTTFSIQMPAVEGASDNARQPARPVAAYAGTETILVVEDEVNVRHLVQRVLKSRGYNVLEARDVTHAAEIAAEYQGELHLLLTDVVMPGLSGPQLAERIVFARPKIRVLYMSGFANRISAELGLTAADALVLHKPFTPEHLARTVRECLDAERS